MSRPTDRRGLCSGVPADPAAAVAETADHVLRFSLRAMGHDDAFVDRVLDASDVSNDTNAPNEEPVR